MTPILLILLGLLFIGVTVWDIRRAEADLLFWMDLLSWGVNKRENPILYRIAVVLQLLGAVVVILIGSIWLIYFG